MFNNITNWTAKEANDLEVIRTFELAKQQRKVDACTCKGKHSSKNKACKGQSDKAVPFRKAVNRLESTRSMVESLKGCADIEAKIMELVEAGTLFILNHSGGKDSQAMQILLERLVPAHQIVVVHADLGRVEWAGVKEHIMATTTQKLHCVKAVDKNGKEKDLLDAVYKRMEAIQRSYDAKVAQGLVGKLSPPWFSPSQRYCTSHFKTGPIEKFIRAYMKEHGFTTAVNCMGIRGQESGERAQNVPFLLNDDLSKAGRTVYNWLPIFDMLLEGEGGVWDVIESSGQVPHEVYSKGMSRLSCCFCMMASKKDLGIAARLNPALFAEYVTAEKVLGYTMVSGKSLEEIAGITVAELQAAA